MDGGDTFALSGNENATKQGNLARECTAIKNLRGIGSYLEGFPDTHEK